MRHKIPQSFTIKNVDLWNADLVRSSVDLDIRDGKIEKIFKSTSSAPARFALIPSGVDNQVHLRVPGQEQKETAETGLKAALFGGYGAVLSMPNTRPVIDDPQILRQALAIVQASQESHGVRTYFSVAISKGQLGQELVDFKSLADAGAKAFTDDGLGLASGDLMAEAFSKLESVGLPLLQHSEFLGHHGVLAPGPIQKKLGVKDYPDEPEIAMLLRDLELLKKFPKARYHLLHATSRRVLPALAEARKLKLKVTAEVSPHHLYFNVADIDISNTAFKMNPPIRSVKDQADLLNALVEGQIDFMATDHAPHTAEDKGEDFTKSAFGTLGLETALPVLLKFWQDKKISASRLVEVFSSGPARFLGIDDEFGRLEEGRSLRAVLIEPGLTPRKFGLEDIHSKSKNSCFLGRNLVMGLRLHFNFSGIFDVSSGFKLDEVLS